MMLNLQTTLSLFYTDFRGHFMYHNDTLIFNLILKEPGIYQDTISC